jgi:hypothetical protein
MAKSARASRLSAIFRTPLRGGRKCKDAPRETWGRWGWLLMTVLGAMGCQTIHPSNYRDWSADQAVPAQAEFSGDQVTVRNVRNCRYLATDTYVLDYEDRTYDLADVESADFIVVPFPGLPFLAHTMLSFGFADGRHLAASVEIRREVGESFAPWKGSMRQYELMYVLGDERDLIDLRTTYRSDDVYLYRTTATPEQARSLLVDVLQRANDLAKKPEYYDTLANNCTTNIARHVNRLDPDRVPYSVFVMLPGLSDRYAYQSGLLEQHGSFEETKRRANISHVARNHAHSQDFSQAIRR